MIAAIALVIAILHFVMVSLVLVCAIKNGLVSMVSDKPKRPLKPKDQGSSWEAIRETPTCKQRLLQWLKGQKPND